jgi:UDP-GlcNAc:undecaprenyl-phosphate/decaprenyl-phosphate GlcNAc-1-phosphate transferase
MACCSFADRLGRVLGVIDHPDGVRKHHARPTPLVGGIALMVPLLWIALDEALGSRPGGGTLFVVLALATIGFMALGWLDDRHHLPPLARLVISTSLCALVLALEPGLQLTALDLGSLWLPLGLFALPFTVLCLVGLQNALNMADGLNGLVIGLAIFWTSCLLLYAPEPLMTFLSFLLLGLFILLPYNLMGYLFLGDAGSYSLGVVIGLLMISVQDAAGGALPMATVALWLLIPVLDCLRVMAERLIKNRSPLAADRNHLHHRLSRHWPWPASVLVYLALACGPGLIAALWPPITGVLLVVALGGYVGVLWVTCRRSVLALEHRNPPAS